MDKKLLYFLPFLFIKEFKAVWFLLTIFYNAPQIFIENVVLFIASEVSLCGF